MATEDVKKAKKAKKRTSDGGEPPKAKKHKTSSLDKMRLPPHKYILAPMVGGSELAFRLLCRRYASETLLCYTPMIHSDRFATESAYRAEAFQTCAADRPLVAHFAGNDPKTMLAAARHVEGHCDAVDLNLGCPQRIAHSGHFGSYLLDEADRSLVCSIVRALAKELSVPVFCKVRLLETTQETVRLVTQLRDAGAALVAIHARHRVNLVGRSGPGARDGPALLDEVAKVVDAVKGVVIVANGNVKTWDDVKANLRTTGAKGIMSAEGILDDPALFHPSMAEDSSVLGEASLAGGGDAGGGADDVPEVRELRKVRKKLREIERLEAKQTGGGSLTSDETEKVSKRASLEKQLKKLARAVKEAAAEAEAAATKAAKKAKKADKAAKDAKQGSSPAAPVAPKSSPTGAKPPPIALALEYMELAERHGVPLRTVVFHVRRMAKEVLTRVQLLAELLETSDVKAVRALVEEAARRERDGWKPDPERMQKEREALELKKWREQTRKRFEERMVRKAVREGREPDHYLKQGAAVPTVESLAKLRAMGKEEAWAAWKEQHGQHCWAMHLGEGGCTRERTCAFLHADVVKSSDPAWHG